MNPTRQLYRSRNALVGGVCAGIAERFDVDPLVVRILFLTFAVLTLGLAGLAYLVLWAVLPKRPMQVKPVKVEPDSVHSDTFGAVDCRRARGAAMGRCANAVPYVSAAHLPPMPPAMAEGARCEQGPAMGADVASVEPHDAKAGEGDGPSTARIVLALAVGCLLASLGASFAVSGFLHGVAWWQCWPLALVVFGIVRIAVPGGEGERALAFFAGVSVFAVGLTLLPMSMGFISWATLPKMFECLWPLPALAAVLLAMGAYARRPVVIVAAAVLVLLFCVLGFDLFSEPGPLRELSFGTPLGREYRFPLPFDYPRRLVCITAMRSALGRFRFVRRRSSDAVRLFVFRFCPSYEKPPGEI